MRGIIIQDSIFIIVVVFLAWPLGIYIEKIMNQKKIKGLNFLHVIEKRIYKGMGIASPQGMTAKEYTLSVILFSSVGLIFLFFILLFQGFLPLNPEKFSGVTWDLAFNIAASFVTNTNWQAYSGEITLSYFSQFMGLTVQNFFSAGVGIAVFFALVRGFVFVKKEEIGNFWEDLVRIILYLLLPLSIVMAIILVTQGVVQTFSGYLTGFSLQDGTELVVPLGPAASQIAIKALGTNGGGFFGTNAAFPFENPTFLSNFIENIAIILIPVSLCFTFGKAVKDMKQGRTILIIMFIIFISALIVVTFSEVNLGPQFQGVASNGNLEGKEIRFGIGGSALWAVATTAASNGSVNAMLDSFTPFGGGALIFLMQLGEIIFGGVGSGFYAMIAFAMLAIFIGGLMVGRTPEYLGKKIEPFDMKMVCIVILVPPLTILFGTALGTMTPEAQTWLTNTGAHGFSEILYAFTSAGANNGSAFGGYLGNTLFSNLTLGVIMLVARFIPMGAIIYLSGHLAGKKAIPVSEGTLSTTSILFVGLVIAIILLIGALSFLPTLALGPIADYFTSLV
ncbi:MAG: potassium-transporting ATPase subunit KdpA [Eubacteriaceae bacterium]